MALTFKGVERTKTTASPPINSMPGSSGGTVRVYTDVLRLDTIPGTGTVDSATSDILELGGGGIPKGARVLEGTLTYDGNDITSVLTCAISDSSGNTMLTVADKTAGASTITVGTVNKSHRLAVYPAEQAPLASIGYVAFTMVSGELTSSSVQYIRITLYYVID